MVSDIKRCVKGYELGEKAGKTTGSKTHNGNNLAKLNDAKRTILCARPIKNHSKKKEIACILWG